MPISVPVRLLQGQADPDVPWETALKIAGAVTGGDVQVLLVKDGDHRLSRPEDLLLLRRAGRGPARRGWRRGPRGSPGYSQAMPSAALVAALATLRFSVQKLRAMGDMPAAACS